MAGTQPSKKVRNTITWAQTTTADREVISDLPQALSEALDEIGTRERIPSLRTIITARREDGSFVVNSPIQVEIMEALDKVHFILENPPARAEAPIASLWRKYKIPVCRPYPKFVGSTSPSQNRTWYRMWSCTGLSIQGHTPTPGRGNVGGKTCVSRFSESTRRGDKKRSKRWAEPHLARSRSHLA